MDKSELKELIKSSKVLDEAMRESLLAQIDGLAPDKIEKVAALIKTAEEKYVGIMSDLDAKKREINQAYLDKVNHFFRKTVPAVMKDIEAKDKHEEEADLDELLSQLDNL